MTSTTSFDRCMDRVARGERLSPDEVRELAAAPDILALGMLADALKRHLHDRRVTFLRVAESPFDRPFDDGVPASAGELRLTGEPQSLGTAIRAVAAARAKSGDRSVAAYSWGDVERWSGELPVGGVLRELKAAGLDALADVSLDALESPEAAIGHLVEAGYGLVRLSVRQLAAAARTDLFLDVRRWQEMFGGAIRALNPLPSSLSTFRPTTGYEDVKMVAVARLAAPNVTTIQVDWRRYGPKLAQVALTFGADDVDGISASDDAPEGRRRAALPEIHRNIEAAGQVAAERDGRFVVRG